MGTTSHHSAHLQQEKRWLIEKVEELTAVIQRQEEQLKDLDAIAKKLVQRDFGLQQMRADQRQLIKELDHTAKRLVRKDLELLQTNEQLQELNTLKSRIIDLASHQLRTPVSVIRWTLEILGSNDANVSLQQQHRLIGDALEATRSLSGIIRDLLVVSQMESGGASLQKKRVDITSLVRKVHMQWQEEAARRHLAFTVELPRKGMFFIAADRQKLSGALGNIIENAILYTPEGSVTVTLSVEHDCCVIEIQDTGIGIAPADLPSIFSRLFRAQNAMLYKTHGNGLGLYVTKEIIEEHEGSIQVQSELGKGTRVTVRLPLES